MTGTDRAARIDARGSMEAHLPLPHHAGADTSLLVLRLVLAACMGLHGLVKVFGFFGGPGLHTFGRVLQGYGFSHGITALSWITGLTEVLGGAALVIGLLTPLAAAGLFGVGMSVVIAKSGGGFFEGQGTGYEFELTLAVIALALMMTGAGRYSVDAHSPLRHWPTRYGAGVLALAVVASIVITLAF
jgi:putative oxidoreductase